MIAQRIGLDRGVWTRRARPMLLGLVLVALDAPAAFSQARIEGRVTNGATGEPLPGVRLIVEGTDRGAITDANGTYVLSDVPPGRQVIAARYIGYQTTRITVSVSLGIHRDVDIAMGSGSAPIDEIAMSGTAKVFPTFFLPVGAMIGGLLLMSWAERRRGGRRLRPLSAAVGGGAAGVLFAVFWLATGGADALETAVQLGLQGAAIGIWLGVWSAPPKRLIGSHGRDSDPTPRQR